MPYVGCKGCGVHKSRWNSSNTSTEKRVDAYSDLAVLSILLVLGYKNDHNRVHKCPTQDCIQAELYTV